MKNGSDFFPLGASHAPYLRAKGPDISEWRDDLDAEELALVESWDRIYAQATLKICEDMLALEEGW